MLPLASRTAQIAVVGPLAAAPREMQAMGHGERPRRAVTILDGLRAAMPEAKIVSPRASASTATMSGIAAALEIARGADLVVLCLGEAAAMSGEAATRADSAFPGGRRRWRGRCLSLGGRSWRC